MPAERFMSDAPKPINGFEIHWGRDHDSIGVTPLETDTSYFKSINQILRELGKTEITEEEWVHKHGAGRILGHHATWICNRRNANRLIAVIKRARDQAFGKDE